MPKGIGVDFGDFLTWSIQALLTGCVIYGVGVLGAMRNSIEQLNVQIAVVLEKTVTYEKTFERHEDRLRGLERELSRGRH